jgi:hypothetical protein
MKSVHVEVDKSSKNVMGEFDMGVGIKISGMNNVINDNQIKTDDVGIHIEGDENEALRNNIEIHKPKLVEIIKKLNLPENLPPEYLLEAIEILSKVANTSQAPNLLESSSLKNWLNKNGFNMSFWVSTAISLASIIKT